VTKAFSGDARPEQTAATRYADNTASRQTLSLQHSIVPQPLAAKTTGGTLVLNGTKVRVSAPKALRGEASYLTQALGNVLGGKRNARGKQTITLRLNPELDTVHDGKSHPDGYTLDIDGKGITIVGNTAAGVLYGVQSLRQIIPASAYQAAAQGHAPTTIPLPRASIKDAPLLAYRGLGIDVSRHFESVQTVEKFIDLESYLKMNALHLHLTDDEGWRLQIPGLPELTGFGSRRGFDPAETRQLHQGMGAGSGLGPGDGIAGKAANPTQANLGRTPAYQGFEDATRNFLGQGDGYYTPAQFESILRYAAQRHVQVIPEFDLPAHARAAVQSMERRYKTTGDSTYRLLDPNDTSKHTSVQYYNDNVVNPCVPGTYNFITKVTTEVAKMYKAAGVPLSVISMGGDEAPANAWDGSQACKSNPDTTGKTDAQLWDYFEGRYNTIAQKVAPRTSGWEDVLLDGAGNSKLPNFVALPWQNVWGWGREQVAYQLANAGTPVVLASATNLYMDLAYNKDPNEPGYYWAEYVDEKSTFTYQPYDIYANDTEDRWGNPSKPDPNWTRLTAQGRQNVLGLEAEMFGENGDNPQIREYQAFPKLLGAAERAWYRDTPAPGQMDAAFNVFNNTLGQKTFPLLSYYQPVGLPRSADGVNYRIPLPGGQISGGTLTVNLRDPGMTLQYSTDGVHWNAYTGPVHVGDTALLRTLAVDGRSSRLSPVGLPNWAATTSYPAGSLVNYKGNIYRAVNSASAGQTPQSAPSRWTELQ
jgi:hexosaminidase